MTAAVAWSSVPAQASVCFTSVDNAKLSFAVLQQAPPPTSRADSGYPYYPYTGQVTMQLGRIGSGSNVENQYYAQWANRSDKPILDAPGRAPVDRKANLQPRMQGSRAQRSKFDSIERADLCTLAQSTSVLGLPLEPLARQAQSLGVVLQKASSAPDVGALSPENVCVLPDGVLPPRAAGMMLDYEVQDGRTPAQTAQFLAAYADLIHSAGKKVGLLTNPLDAPTQRWTGINQSNAASIAKRYDWSTIFLWSGNRQHDVRASFESQIAVLQAGGGVDSGRLIANFELANTTLDDARVVRELIKRNKLMGVMLWRNGASQGGECAEPVNRRIACVTLGECGGGSP